MSRNLIPSLFDSRGDWDYPTRFYDRRYGFGLSDEDFFAPTVYRERVMRPRMHPTRQVTLSGKPEVTNNSEKFQVMVDVSHFNPEDITVKTVDNYVVVCAKHEERADQHGFVSREFTRKYILPSDVEPENVVSSLSLEGVLTVEASKNVGKTASNERIVPVARKETPLVTNQQEEQK